VVVELKEVNEKATKKKGSHRQGAKRTRKKNDWRDKECEQLKNEAIKALIE
jgi:hypothetical protein